MKVSTNTPLYEQKHTWIDFNAGTLVEEKAWIFKQTFYRLVVEVASGKQALNEKKGYREIAILKQGVTL